jgi:hypothetical protein
VVPNDPHATSTIATLFTQRARSQHGYRDWICRGSYVTAT